MTEEQVLNSVRASFETREGRYFRVYSPAMWLESSMNYIDRLGAKIVSVTLSHTQSWQSAYIIVCFYEGE